MTEQNGKRQTLTTLRNVGRLLSMVEGLKNRGDGVPGMGCFYGYSGLGKSMAASFCVNATGAIHVQMKLVWTQKKLCQSILDEMGLTTSSRTSVPDMVDLIANFLQSNELPLIIDEADFLVRKNMIEIARDIYEMSEAPVILIGEELLPQKLKRWERIHRRLRYSIPAEFADDRDFDLLREIRCPGIEIDEDLVAAIKAAGGGSAGRLVVNLDAVEETSRRIGRKRVGLADHGDDLLFTGEAPLGRGYAA